MSKQKSKKTKKLDVEIYNKELNRLQTELAIMQDWVKATGQRIVVVFEGRDAAGKGGVIRRMTERVSTRVFRVVALPAPSDREKTQIYILALRYYLSNRRLFNWDFLGWLKVIQSFSVFLENHSLARISEFSQGNTKSQP